MQSRIVYKDYVSNFFPCLSGVRQGKHLSISFFVRTISENLNNWETFLTIKYVQSAKSISKDFDNEFQIYVKLFTVLYADDTVLLAESSEETVGVNN
jgi:hypothetical protein